MGKKKWRTDDRGRLRSYYPQGYEEEEIPPGPWWERVLEWVGWTVANVAAWIRRGR